MWTKHWKLGNKWTDGIGLSQRTLKPKPAGKEYNKESANCRITGRVRNGGTEDFLKAANVVKNRIDRKSLKVLLLPTHPRINVICNNTDGPRDYYNRSKSAAAAKSRQSCPTLSDPMDCSPPGSSVHGIFQARVLEWGAISQTKTNNHKISHICGIWNTEIKLSTEEKQIHGLSRWRGLRQG